MTSITQDLMDTGEWSLDLDPATPTNVLDDISIRTRLWATYIHTPAHWNLDELSEADLRSQARYAGVLLGNGQDRLHPNGEDIMWWLGKNGDGGALYASTDTTQTGLDLEAHLDARVFNAANGITKGSVNADATTFSHKREGGDTRREMLDTLASMAPGGPYLWRINYDDYTLDVDTQATLWPTTSSPTVILAEEGGREGVIVGLYADLDLDDLDGSEVRTSVQVDWNDGTSNGSAAASLPSTYGNLTGGSPAVITLIDWRPKRNRPPTERWRRVAAWGIAAQARANILATREVNERTLIRNEITATLPGVTDPWRFDITPGNTVYVDDIDRGLVNTANQVQYRGETVFPTTGRVDQMTVEPEDGGHYLRCWNGSAFEWIDVTKYVIPGDGSVTLGLEHRNRLGPPSRARGLTRRQRRSWYARAHRQARAERRR